MAYPDRTYVTVTLPGAKNPTKILDTPVDGGLDGSDTPGKVKYLENFVAIEDTGVGHVETVHV